MAAPPAAGRFGRTGAGKASPKPAIPASGMPGRMPPTPGAKMPMSGTAGIGTFSSKVAGPPKGGGFPFKRGGSK